MADRAALPKMVKVRVEADLGESEGLSAAITTVLENSGFEVIEFSRPFPVRAEQSRERTFIGAIRKNQEEVA